MELDIRDVIDSKALESLINSFVLATGLNAMFISRDGNFIISPKEHCKACALCDMIGAEEKGKKRCFDSMQKSGLLSMQIGEPYIAVCHAGLIEIYSPVLFEQEYLGVVTCGPVLLWTLDEIARTDIISRIGDIGIDVEKAIAAAEKIQTLNGRNIMAAADLLFNMVNHIARTGITVLMQRREMNRQQMRFADLIIERKREEEKALRYAQLGSYPLGKERELLSKVRLGDKNGAMEILNELLALVFYNNAGNMDVIKARVLELIVVLSRAAVESGAELDKLLGLNYDYVRALYGINKFEDLCMWVVGILDTFMQTVYVSAAGKKSLGVLADALEIVRSDYAQDLTLKEVADRIHISPYYLSHMFSEKLGFTFLEYLTNVRIEEAKRLISMTKLEIREVALRTGYGDAGYFSKVFKKQTGMSPGEYRKSPAAI